MHFATMKRRRAVKNLPTEFAHISGISLSDCIEEGLKDVWALVASCPDAADARAFRRQAESYARTVTSWKAFKPTDEQRHAMLECISEMLATMCAYAPSESGTYAALPLDGAEND